MHKNNFSGPYQAKSRVLNFVQPVKGAEKIPVSAGRVKVPVGMGQRVILVAISGRDGKYHFFPIADSFKQFRAGGTKIINITKVAISTRLSKKRYQVAAMKVQNIPRHSDKKKPYSYPVEFYFREGKKWKPFYSGYWLHEPDVRNLTFCYRDPFTNNLRLRTIRDLPKPSSDQ